MDNIKSLDVCYNIISALLTDAHALHGDVFNTKALRNTTGVVKRRVFGRETEDFLTEVLPRLGKALDRALLGQIPMNKALHGFKTIIGSELPQFLGEFFMCIFDHHGQVLPNPCTKCIRVVRQICYLFYKYELPYSDEKTNKVVEAFKQAENDLSAHSLALVNLNKTIENCDPPCVIGQKTADPREMIAREARSLLHRLFRYLDPQNIVPNHGPGAVATRQRLWGKFLWSNVSESITNIYPFDAYFCASIGHVCDSYHLFSEIGNKSLPARVCLVPKDSRGPRLISSEPVDNQWIQQGLRKVIVELVEKSELTKFNVFFTDQRPNQMAALQGSSDGKTASLDLKEASDRVHVDLVRLLFPQPLLAAMECCRSLSTVLPNGQELKLLKFAPMGSALCFPIMALTIWSILTAAAPDADTKRGILVYGDDVIVPTAYAESAIAHLEAFGLLVNQAKSCTTGLFRESCGVDAFQGVDVTPVKLKTVWEPSPAPDIYASWISYANSFWDRRYYRTYHVISDMLLSVYKRIPCDDMEIPCLSLRYVPLEHRPRLKRWCKKTHRLLHRVYMVEPKLIHKKFGGWNMLLRYFTEGKRVTPLDFVISRSDRCNSAPVRPFSVSQYTDRDTSELVLRWR